MMWNNLNVFMFFYFLVLAVSVQCPYVENNFSLFDPFQIIRQDNTYEDVDQEMVAYWKSGLIDPHRDAVYEELFRFAQNCYRYVTTFEAYRDAYPEKLSNDEDNQEILKRAQMYAVFHACENTVGVVVSYYQAMQNDGHLLPNYVLVNYAS